MKPVRTRIPDGKWNDLVKEAFSNSIDLTATEFHEVPFEFNWGECEGSPFIYYVYGAACTEVEVDCLTGDHRILRTDITVDLGMS